MLLKSFYILKELEMTILNVKALYDGEEKLYQVLPYDLIGVIKHYLQMKNGFRYLYIFMRDSRFSERSAQKLADKYNRIV